MARYTGARAMRGRKGKDIRHLKKQIAAQQAEYQSGMSKRGMWGSIGNALSTFFPGLGNIADLAINQIAQHNIDVGDPGAISGAETMWTEGLAQEMADAFGGQVAESETSLLEGLLGQAPGFLGSTLGSGLTEKLGFGPQGKIGSVPGKFQDWQGDWFDKLTGGGGGRTNQSGRTYVFGAWADVSFKYNNTF